MRDASPRGRAPQARGTPSRTVTRHQRAKHRGLHVLHLPHEEIAPVDAGVPQERTGGRCASMTRRPSCSSYHRRQAACTGAIASFTAGRVIVLVPKHNDEYARVPTLPTPTTRCATWRPHIALTWPGRPRKTCGTGQWATTLRRVSSSTRVRTGGSSGTNRRHWSVATFGSRLAFVVPLRLGHRLLGLTFHALFGTVAAVGRRRT
jgi:hypothetical protein